MEHTCNKEKELGILQTDVKYIKKAIDDYILDSKERIKNVEDENKLNTDFRLQAKGIIGFISFVSVALGGFLMWLIDKIKVFN